jgi:serine protease AprX
LRDADRISPPADSIRGLTVGSVAHKGTPNTVVQANHPSPFSRRGPGAAYAMKPEVSFPGGNCDMAGDYLQTGVLSIHGNGSIAENIGTSFATPLASTVAAHVFHELEVDGEIASPAFVKGLMVHSAFVKNPIGQPEDVRYYGLKDTLQPWQIVQCSQSSATIILTATVNPKNDFGKRPFPLPPCLETDAGLVGEIFMTLIYNPPLDRKYGIEYCRCNVKATLGAETPSVVPGGKPKYKREVHPAPEKRAPSGYDKDMVEHGYKWSPLKLYYREFQRGLAGKRWRLTLDALNRAEFAGEELDVIIFITIRSQQPGANVYNEMVQEMNRLGWGATDLRLRSTPPRSRA